MTTLTPAQTNVTLKAVSRSIISLRSRLDSMDPASPARAPLQAELDELTRAREALEASE